MKCSIIWTKLLPDVSTDNTFKLAERENWQWKRCSPEVSYSDPGWIIFPSRVRLCSALPICVLLRAALSPCPAISALDFESHLRTSHSHCLLHMCSVFSFAILRHSQVLAPLLQSCHGKSECSPSELQIRLSAGNTHSSSTTGEPHTWQNVISSCALEWKITSIFTCQVPMHISIRKPIGHQGTTEEKMFYLYSQYISVAYLLRISYYCKGKATFFHFSHWSCMFLCPILQNK